MTDWNHLDKAEFVRVVGPVFERSPWIAERAWPKRPFADVNALLRSLIQTVRDSGEAAQLELIRAHPDLAVRLGRAEQLTRESLSEQAAAGLGGLAPGELEQFQQLNAHYRERFGFPFVICARLNKRDAILAAFRQRLKQSRKEEVETALQEIFKIAELRLRDLTLSQ